MGWQGSSDTGDQVWRQGPRVEFNIFRETGLRDPAHQLSKKDCMKIGSHGACVRNLIYVSRMRSNGSRFTLGVWGLRVCSLDVAFTSATVRNPSQPFVTVRNRSQPFATVRNRPRDCYMAVPMVISAEGVLFRGFKRTVASFRVASVALRDIQTCFVTRRKSFCVAILSRRFQKMRGKQAQHFGRVHRHFSWQAQHFGRVELRVFCEPQWQGCVKWRRRGILWDVLKIDGRLARNIDFEVANSEVPKKSRRKTSILRLQRVKIGENLPRNARFAVPTCLVLSLWCSCGFAVSVGEAAKHPFRMFPTVKISGNLARNARFGAPMCLVSSLWCSCGFAVSMGEAAKPPFSHVSNCEN